MKIDKEVLGRIEQINWFVNCGKPIKTKLNINITYVSSWEEAKSYYQNPNWENTTLEAGNELTSFLHNNYKNQFSNWNRLVRQAKLFIEKEIVPKITLVKEKNKLDQVFVDCVDWDIINAIMEQTYQNCGKRPTFFLELLKVYESGNFPCGWEGKWPNGTLVVY